MAIWHATLDFNAPLRELDRHAATYAGYFEVHYEVMVLRGENGYPVVRFTGEISRLDKLLTHYHRGTDREELLR